MIKNKVKTIFLIALILIIVSLLTYLNYDKILNYFTNREWEIAGSIGSIELEGYLDTCGTSSNFIVVGNNFVQGYSNDTKKNFENNISLKNVLTYSAGDYAIIGEKDLTNVIVINENDIVWSTSISNANIFGVYINKNGYAAVIYSQTGYKSLIKVFSNTGEELFTNYLASTYAIDVGISNDNKTLAIAEVDTSGISVASSIKLIDIQTMSESTIKKYDLDNNEMATDIEYSDNNDLIIMTDMAVKILNNDNISTVANFDEQHIILANITNKKNVVAVRIEEDGLFNSKCLVNIYSLNDVDNVKSYELEDVPNRICTMKNIIAVDTGNEIIFLNNSGNFVKKCEYKGQLKDIELFNDGNTAVLMFRNNAEFVKVGGI